MPVTEPLFQMIVPCQTCSGTGERPAEQFAGGFEITAAGGGKLQCRDCSGSGGELTAVPLSAVAEAIRRHQAGSSA
jgi:hypothetical protein